jgi:MoaA/NifB/PqqE/SkfB family radical SAM enzyme
MCDSWKKPPAEDLTTTEIEDFFTQLPRMDIVRLSGGEPFIREDLSQIAHLVQRSLKPMALHLTSNGFLTDRIVRFCEERGKEIPLEMLISIDGMREKHNHTRGRSSAWDHAVRTLKALAPRQKELRLRLAVNQTIVDADGLDQYKRLREYLRPLGIYIHVVFAYEASATYHEKPEVNVAPTQLGEFTLFGQIKAGDVEELLNELERDLGDRSIPVRFAKSYYLRGIRNRILGLGGQPNPHCVALSSHLRLLPDGSVPTCQFNTITVGNLRHQRFEEIWQSETTRKQRSWVNACPGCWAECEVLPNALYTGDLVREYLSPRSLEY